MELQPRVRSVGEKMGGTIKGGKQKKSKGFGKGVGRQYDTERPKTLPVEIRITRRRGLVKERKKSFVVYGNPAGGGEFWRGGG